MKTLKIYDQKLHDPHPNALMPAKKAKAVRLGITILLAFGIGVYAGTGIGNGGGQVATVAADDAAVHIVEDGETLWDIARGIADVRGQDIRETIYELQINNDIGDNDNLQPGQRIIIR